MAPVEIICKCACGSQNFQLRLKRDEQVGLLTCAVGHHSLLLDSRDYWADVLQERRPAQSRCRCGGVLFRVALEYEFRVGGDVRSVSIKPTCSECGREQRIVLIDIKYSPTELLIANPLDPIEQPWLQPKRHEITSLWKPADAERFANHLSITLGARVFSRSASSEFSECGIESVQFFPELKRDLLFTNMPELAVPFGNEPQRSSPFLRLSAPFHMLYSLPSGSEAPVHLLHYVQYSREVVTQGRLEKQPPSFLEFARQACEWLNQNFVTSSGKNTADNLEEYLRATPHLHRSGAS
jgi:hypothetical protein